MASYAYSARTKTYNLKDQVQSSELNAIQDGVVACSDAIGDLDEISGASLIADLTTVSSRIRIVPWGSGHPLKTAAPPTNLYLAGGPGPYYIQVDNVAGGSFRYDLDRYFGQLQVENLTKILCRFARSDAAAVLTVQLRREVALTGVDSLLQTFTASDSTGAWAAESTAFTQAYDGETYTYYLLVTITPNVAVTDVKLRHIEVEFDGKYIG